MNEEQNIPRRRPKKRRSKFQKFIHRYFPSIVLVGLAVCCVSMVIFTVSTVTSLLDNNPTEPQLNANPTQTTVPAGITEMEAQELIKQADKLAATYDYTGAIALLEAADGYEEVAAITDKITQYQAADEKLVPYADIDSITHIFFHSLIVDPARAFDGDGDQNGYNLYMVTVAEFEKILQQMYDKGYVLVSPYDIAYEVIEDGTARFEYGTIRLPEGKIPFLMSQDDVNYYSYMIGTGSGVNETPIFADSNGDGFASRIVIGDDGYPTCEYVDENGKVTTGNYDLVPVLESFIQSHPDFSYHGARAILGMTGYEGVFGYRTKPSYEAALGAEDYKKEVEQAKAVAQCLKEHGWILASHSYGHPAYGNLTPERVETDSDKWEQTCEYIVGETDILLYPHGSDIAGVGNYTMDNGKFAALYADGYRYFFNVDSKIAWCQVGDNYFRGGRRNIDGYRMFHHPEKLEDLFNVTEVFDPARPTPVPPISGSM